MRKYIKTRFTHTRWFPHFYEFAWTLSSVISGLSLRLPNLQEHTNKSKATNSLDTTTVGRTVGPTLRRTSPRTDGFHTEERRVPSRLSDERTHLRTHVRTHLRKHERTHVRTQVRKHVWTHLLTRKTGTDATELSRRTMLMRVGKNRQGQRQPRLFQPREADQTVLILSL